MWFAVTVSLPTVGVPTFRRHESLRIEAADERQAGMRALGAFHPQSGARIERVKVSGNQESYPLKHRRTA